MRRTLILLILSITSAQYTKISYYDCNTNVDCVHRLPNSICFGKKCICQFGHDVYGCKSNTNIDRDRRQISHGEKMLGEECNWSRQCRQTPVDGTKVCLARKCQCSHGYIPVDAYRCIKDFEPVSPTIYTTSAYRSDLPGFGSACLTDRDCQQTGVHLECIRGTCVCFDGYVPLGKYICYNTRGEGAHILESSPMIPFVRTSTTASSRPADNNQIFRSIGKIGNSCTNDYFCRRAVSQSHCYNGKCACMDDYIAIDLYTCMKRETTTSMTTTLIPFDYKSLLGGRCLTKRNCHTSIAVCLQSICTCPKGFFPVDDWSCLEDSEASDEESVDTTPTIPTTTTTPIFRWWPWSPTPTTPRPYVTLKNAFRARCLLNRQCAAMDKNSHCEVSGRCVCNSGYELRTTRKGQHCILQILNDDNCD